MDNDKQGNLSKSFRQYDDEMTISRVLKGKSFDLHEIIKPTIYEQLDIITANTGMIQSCMELSLNKIIPQQLCFQNAFNQVKEEYDYLIIDNAPDVNVAVVNSLVCTNDVIIPIMIDEYVLTGLKVLMEQIELVKTYYNPKIAVKGLITAYKKSPCVDEQIEGLDNILEVYKTRIKRTEGKVIESTFAGVPVVEVSRRCGASRSYMKFVKEYLDEEWCSYGKRLDYRII